MSLTMRDAQYLSWKTFKKLEKAEQELPVSGSISDVISKTEAIMKKIKASQGIDDKEVLGQMFSELFFLVFVIAEQNGVNLEESFMAAVDEIIIGSVK